AGIAVGSVNGGTVINTNAVDCHVTTKGQFAHAGIGVGMNNRTNVTNTTAVNCTVETSKSDYSAAGIGAGKINNGSVTSTLALNCKVTTFNFAGHAGIGAGYSLNSGITNTMASNCTVSTHGFGTSAGIGAGFSTNSMITDTKAVKCTVSTSQPYTYAGIGTGLQFQGGIVAHTTARNCTVKAPGAFTHIGIGAGLQNGIVTNTEVFNSTVISSYLSHIDIKQGDSYIVCNVLVNNVRQKDVGACQAFPNGFCADFDSSLVKPNCQVANVINPLYVTNSTLVLPITACMKPGAITYFSRPGFDSSTTPLATTATVPDIPSPAVLDSSTTPLATATKAPPMTISSPGSTPTPPTESLSPAFIAIIATLGAAFVVLLAVIGVYTYRNYCRRSSTNAGRNQPMPEQPERRPRVERPLPSPPRYDYQLVPISPVNTSTLPTPPRGYYQPVSGSQGNTSTLPAALQSHYQPLSDNRGNRRTLRAPHQSHYQPLSASQGNTSALPDSLQSHYQPLSDNRGNGRTLRAPPQSHYQPLTGSQWNTATGGSNPPAGNPAPSEEQQPVYYVIENLMISAADGQARPATADSTTPMASTGHEPTPQHPVSPGHPVMTAPETDFDHNYDELTPAGMATEGSSHGEHE
ncbi:hypothetical protein, partial [Endozoicomonas sp. ONNA2]|uniref:hypothetical protein n=1 Tax=Endozoicomonas sp. ONNA2 TaxID=2828741 RepID=UPI0021480FBA